MYDEIIEIAENRAYLQAVKDGYGHGPNLDLLNTLPPYEELKDFERNLEENNYLTFHRIFKEPIGYYHIKLFLLCDYSVDKAVFLLDVSNYKSLRDPSARITVAQFMVERYLSPNYYKKYAPGQSVFDRDSRPPPRVTRDPDARSAHAESASSPPGPLETSLNVHTANPLGVFGKPIDAIKKKVYSGEALDYNIFDDIERLVQNDLRLDVFPRFCKSEYYRRYIQCKYLEKRKTTIQDFDILRVLGRGAFGYVRACIKKDTGAIYAMKCIDKRRVMATDSVDTIMYERNFLAVMESNFVVCLKYAVMDDEKLFLVLDLMVGGDLKFHLNKDKRFDEERSRFYAAEVLLGLEHIHSKGIIYRDMKLENVLLDERGHVRISDLGLAVRSKKDKVKGYAGTPGYTAPEVITNKPYNHMADFFSYGVMIYRFLSGQKPFDKRTDRKERERIRAARKRRRQKFRKREKSDLDKNVVEMEPEYPDVYFRPDAKDFLKKLLKKKPEERMGYNGIREIKAHPWFNPIDFGLLEAGYMDPPFVPNQDEMPVQKIGRTNDDKFRKIKLTPEFQHSLVKFPYQSHRALQSEVVDVLQVADKSRIVDRTPETPGTEPGLAAGQSGGFNCACIVL